MKIEIFASDKGMNFVGGDVVEVAPCYDHAEITSLAATSVAYEMLSMMI